MLLTVNGKQVDVAADSDATLLWVIREKLKLTGTKYGCGMALCGACTVHVGGQAVRPCQMKLAQVQGKPITTIEGLSPDGSHPVQKAWIAEQVPILRMADAPDIQVKVIGTDNPPGGIGEVGLPPVAPAIANAVAWLTGARVRQLPMLLDRVLAAMKT